MGETQNYLFVIYIIANFKQPEYLRTYNKLAKREQKHRVYFYSRALASKNILAEKSSKIELKTLIYLF